MKLTVDNELYNQTPKRSPPSDHDYKTQFKSDYFSNFFLVCLYNSIGTNEDLRLSAEVVAIVISIADLLLLAFRLARVASEASTQRSNSKFPTAVTTSQITIWIFDALLEQNFLLGRRRSITNFYSSRRMRR